MLLYMLTASLLLGAIVPSCATPIPSVPPPVEAQRSVAPSVAVSDTPPAPLPPTRVPAPTISPREDWKAKPEKVALLKLNGPVQYVTIHHTAGVIRKGADEASTLLGIQAFHMGGKHWGDIAYDYLIGPSGKVWAGRQPTWQPDSATVYDTNGHVTVCLLGNFEEQEPTPEATTALCEMVGWLLAEYDLTPSDVGIHSDFAATLCPGRNLKSWLNGEGKACIEKEWAKRVSTESASSWRASAVPAGPPVVIKNRASAEAPSAPEKAVEAKPRP